jgi:hypothetical protein
MIALPGVDVLRVEARDDGRLRASLGERAATVSVRQCFPWSDPRRYLSLRDDDDVEFALVDDARTLDPASRAALDRALAEAGFVLEITAVSSIEEEVEVFSWEVTTRQGRRRFQTRLDDWPAELAGGAKLIRDVGGDLYLLRTPESLDRRSRKLLWGFVD